MKHILSLILLAILILAVPVSATINVTADATGDTWITWSWDEGLNVTAIFVDGYLMSGYESTAPSFDITGLSSCDDHIVLILTEFDNGTDTSSTTCPAFVPPQSSGTIRQEGFSGVMWLAFGLVGGIIGIIIIARR